MITFLFWNLCAKHLAGTVAALTKQHDVDIIILAESGSSHGDMLKALLTVTGSPFTVPYSVCDKIVIYTRFSRTFFSVVAESSRTTIQRINAPARPEFLLCAAHLPSQM